MKNECHRRKYPDLSCFHTKNEEIFAIFAPEISTFDAPTWHSTSQLFDGRLLKTSIPLKSQNHVLSFNNFKCQWNGLNIFVTIVDTKTSLLLKSGIDGNSIADSTVKTKFNLEVHVASKYKAFQMKKTPLNNIFRKKIPS